MYQQDGQTIFSASDLTGFLACHHLTQLELARLRGEVTKPHREDPLLDIITELGLKHEERFLEGLKTDGLNVVAIGDIERDLGSLISAAEETAAAMRSGADVIYQATFFDGTWRGHADFLRKVQTASDLGEYSYEVWDTKLARRAKATAVLQICDYSRHVEVLQGIQPEFGHLWLGDLSLQSFKLSDYAAYYRAVRSEFEATLVASPIETYPDPVEHCKICAWLPRCMQRRRDDRHLTFVAGIRKDQISKLQADGVPTIDALAESLPERGAKGISQPNFAPLQDQAALQVERERSGEHRYKILDPPGPGLGLEALPSPSDGDLFFDIESDRYAIDEEAQGELNLDGLEYLFGWVDAIDGDFHHEWAHASADEKDMFERFVDLMIARLDSHPDMHIYHYSPYEPSALKRLMSRYGTREDEVDRLLRAQVFVDLYRVVKQSLRISEESYSIKRMEVFYDFERKDDITEAGSSMVEYEHWRDTGDDSILEAILIYNEADCRSLVGLRDWLEERRSELEKTTGELPRPPILDGKQDLESAEARTEVQDLIDALVAGVPAQPSDRADEQQTRWLLAQLLEWHRREEKSDWWAYYERQKQTVQELLEDRDTIAGLEFDEIDGGIKQSYFFRYSFPDQETKLDRGASVIDVYNGANAGTVWNIDFENRKVWLKRGKRWAGEHPTVIGPGAPPRTTSQRNALKSVARELIDGGSSYKAAMALLRREVPGVPGVAAGESLRGDDEASVDAAKRLVLTLQDSYLPIQGPPGTGKTYTGGFMIVDLMRAGKRVGITATSHKVISNLVESVCEAAQAEGFSFKGVQKCDEDEGCRSPFIELVERNPHFDDMATGGEYQLVAGTSWAITRAALDQTLDVLFIDEAGQFSLANTIAVATAAHNLVLLGDPQQLNQPTKGIHPEGADASALGHVLGDAQTIAPERGLFLERTFRMHPAVTHFVSDAFYDGRLTSEEGRDLQVVSNSREPGIHLDEITHFGNRIFSWEEADAIAATAEKLIGQTWTTPNGETRALAADDIIVVAPFNAQVARIRQKVPEGVPVGTVDKFQGQEGVVAIYSITASSPEDVPRNFEFLYSRNRLNVAVSRARSYAIVVCSPAMLLPMCKKPEHMRLASALCLLAEHAASPAAS